MKDYTEQLDGVEVIYVDAQNEATQQLAQIESFITRGVDSIVIMPVDITSAPDMVARANEDSNEYKVTITMGVYAAIVIYIGLTMGIFGFVQIAE
ncbi:substrate-binding domain-containing protein [Halalkalibacter lacteus]|uniref:substrate-binding domain-containing protein n=1 Tax=Halalkalibacter lacteus TaxID=3090663 RepID=UPI002FC6B41E